jgi:hypothetical protein
MHQKTVLVSLACTAVAALVVAWISGDDSQTRDKSASVRVEVNQQAAANTSNLDRGTVSKPMLQPDGGLTLARQMLVATNVRAFVEHAKQYPEKGGIFLAETAVMNCKQAQWVTDKKTHQELLQSQIARHPQREKFAAQALAAADQVSARCQGFTNEDYANLELYSGKLGQGRAPDPAIEAAKALASAKQGQVWSFDRAQDVARVLSSTDGFVLGGLNLFAAKDATNPSQSVIYMDGKPLAGYAREALYGAELVVNYYQSGLDNPQSIHALVACAFALKCEPLDTQEKMIQAVMEENYSRTKLNKDTLKAQITELVPKLKHAVDTGDYSAFAPPSKGAS